MNSGCLSRSGSPVSYGWGNSDDHDVIKFLNYFTDLSIDEIEKIKNKEINELKILLANETTKMLHGKDEAINCEKAAKEAFSENSTGVNLPSIKLKKDNFKNSINILDLVTLSKLETSKSEIRRLIKGSAVKINNEIVTDDKMNINKEYFKDNFLKLSLGKKRHIKIELV